LVWARTFFALCVFLLFLIAFMAAPSGGYPAWASGSSNDVSITLRYVVEGSFKVFAPSRPDLARIADGALVTVRIWGEDGIRRVWFGVELTGNGSTVLSFNSSYILGPFNELLTVDGEWAGPFPYLAYIDLERPTLEVLAFRIQPQNVCPLFSESDVDKVENVSRVLGAPARWELLGFGEKIVSRIANNVRTIEGAPAALYNCVEFSVYPLFVDPSTPSPGYRSAGVYYPPERTVVALPLDEARFLESGTIWVSGEGVAVVELEPSRVQRFFMLAISPQVAPDWYKYGIWWLNESEIVFLRSWPWIVTGIAVYDAATGALLEADITTFAEEGVLGFIAPTMDLYSKYIGPLFALSAAGSMPAGSGVVITSESNSVRVRLVGVEGYAPEALVELPPGGPSYWLVITVASAIVSLLAAVRAWGARDASGG